MLAVDRPYTGEDGRSRKGAWIEIIGFPLSVVKSKLVAPVRERGLKFMAAQGAIDRLESLP